MNGTIWFLAVCRECEIERGQATEFPHPFRTEVDRQLWVTTHFYAVNHTNVALTKAPAPTELLHDLFTYVADMMPPNAEACLAFGHPQDPERDDARCYCGMLVHYFQESKIEDYNIPNW